MFDVERYKAVLCLVPNEKFELLLRQKLQKNARAHWQLFFSLLTKLDQLNILLLNIVIFVDYFTFTENICFIVTSHRRKRQFPAFETGYIKVFCIENQIYQRNTILETR